MKRILIVDDEPNILMSLDFLMRKSGYQVFIARDGSEAIKIIEEQDLHVILLDIMMPTVDGYEVCEYVKQKEGKKHIKVIFLSAKSKPEDIQKGFDVGADSYMTKPFSTRELMKEVNKLTTENNLQH